MENKEFKLGPIQEAWVKSLEEHPERQMHYTLGSGNKDNYKACCLGEGLITLCKFNGVDPPFDSGGSLKDGFYKGALESYSLLGLYGPKGIFLLENGSLASMNDSGTTWPEIAVFIRANPTLVFKESK